MFYDVRSQMNFVKAWKNFRKDGLWILEFSYFPLLLKNLNI